VPRISEFQGIVITMYPNEHPPPHFHVKHGGSKAVFAIAAGELLSGALPKPQRRLVRQWANEHRRELELNWALIESEQQPSRIAPLR
jgi:uncharacterized protein DUF4160